MLSEIAEKYKLKILFLPVAHPELNSIEMIWSQFKQQMKKKNVNYSLKEVEKHANDYFLLLTILNGRIVTSMSRIL